MADGSTRVGLGHPLYGAGMPGGQDLAAALAHSQTPIVYLVHSIRNDQHEDRDRLNALEGSGATRPSQHASTARFGRGSTAVARRRGVYRRTAVEHADVADEDEDEDDTREDVSKPKNILTGANHDNVSEDMRRQGKRQMAITIGFHERCAGPYKH